MGKRRITTGKPAGPIDTLIGRPVEGEIDLHGLDARAAEIALESFVIRWARTRPGAVVRVITGRGNRSDGPPVIQPLVAGQLAGRLGPRVARFTRDAAGGAFLVQVR